MTLTVLSPVEARVLGVLFEKQYTTPDVYPMTVNALLAGCNQKSSRHPVMELKEADVLSALVSLKARSLVMESYGASGRVLRYAQNLPKWLNVGQSTTTLLVTLILRGPQTGAELRANSDRLCQVADLSSVEAYLDEMSNRKDGALAVKLPRQPGAREARWAHLLCGDVQAEAAAAPAAMSARDEISLLRAEVAELREEVGQLRARVDRFARELGVDSE
jgi:uncharacterized protein YceH (UPF0502 family)